MCTLNSFICRFFFQHFFHTPYYTIHGPGSTWSSKSNQALGKLLAGNNFTRAQLFLISLTSISQFQNKGQLSFNVTGNNSFLLCPRYLAQVGCMKVSQSNYHHIYTQSMHVVLA